MEYQIEEINQNQIEEDYLLKIVMIGDCAVGKSNILSRFIRKQFNQESKSTIGIELSTKIFKIDSKIIKLNIWDTAGQERFSSITNAYYKGTYGAFIVYDITRQNTFLSIDKWLNELKSKIPNNVTIIIIGNKSDLTLLRQVSYDEAKQKADKLNALFYETSALDSSNIEKAFKKIINEVYHNLKNGKMEFLQSFPINQNESKEEERKCFC